MWHESEPSAAPDIMLRCPACGVEPAVFRVVTTGVYCDHCDETVTLASIATANPGVAFPVCPEVDTYIEGGRFAVTR